MSYKVPTALGYQPWGVTNPWVFANYAQPQRLRNGVSPMVFQTAPPFLKSAHLGVTDEERGRRMERYAIAGLTLSAVSVFMAFNYYRVMKKNKVVANRRRRGRRRRR